MELEWPLMLFTTFMAWCAGLFGTQAVLALHDKAQKSQLTSWVVAAVLLVVGGIAVFLHLQHWERIMNGFGHITSGITQELIAIVVLGIVAVVYLVCMRKSDSGASVPQPVAIVAIVASLLLLVVMAHSYMMASRPTWNSVLWVLAVIGEACVLGPATMVLIMHVRKDDLGALGRLPLWGAVVNLVTSLLYVVFVQFSAGAFINVGYHTDPTEPAAGLVIPASIIGAQWPLCWIGIVLVGCLVPLGAALLVAQGAGLLRKVAPAAAAGVESPAGQAGEKAAEAPFDEAAAASSDAPAAQACDAPSREAAAPVADEAAAAPCTCEGAAQGEGEAAQKAQEAPGASEQPASAPSSSEAAPETAASTAKDAWCRWGRVAAARPEVAAAVALAGGLIGTICLRVVFYNTGLSIFPFF